MEVKKIYHEDLQIAKALIKRDNLVTRKYFYQQCYPLFKSIYDNYVGHRGQVCPSVPLLLPLTYQVYF